METGLFSVRRRGMRNVFGQVWHMKVEGGLGEVFRSFTEVKIAALNYTGSHFYLKL